MKTESSFPFFYGKLKYLRRMTMQKRIPSLIALMCDAN